LKGSSVDVGADEAEEFAAFVIQANKAGCAHGDDCESFEI